MFKIRGIFQFLPKSLFDPPYMASEDYEYYLSFQCFGPLGENPMSDHTGYILGL